MTLDATKPDDITNVIADLGAYIRETRAAINTLTTTVGALGAVATVTSVSINGATTLITGTNITDVPWETVLITAVGSETLNNMTGATEGQLKILVLLSGSLTITADDTKFKLISTGPSDDFVMAAGDSLQVVNINGDGAGTDGYWQEVGRSIMVD